MGQFIDLTAKDGFTFPAYVAEPSGKPKGAVVVVQEIFGVNSHIRSVADGFADGLPGGRAATFHRVKPGVELGYTEEDMKAGFELKTAVRPCPAPGVLQDLQAAVDYAAKAGGKVGIVGYCWGGLLGHLARSLPAAGRTSAVSARRPGPVRRRQAARQVTKQAAPAKADGLPCRRWPWPHGLSQPAGPAARRRRARL